jgi:hypothetical protein
VHSEYPNIMTSNRAMCNSRNAGQCMNDHGTERHDITEMLLKVALNIITSIFLSLGNISISSWASTSTCM